MKFVIERVDWPLDRQPAPKTKKEAMEKEDKDCSHKVWTIEITTIEELISLITDYHGLLYVTRKNIIIDESNEKVEESFKGEEKYILIPQLDDIVFSKPLIENGRTTVNPLMRIKGAPYRPQDYEEWVKKEKSERLICRKDMKEIQRKERK